MSESNGFAGREELAATCKTRRYTEAVVDGKRYRLQSLTERERSEWENVQTGKDGNHDPKKTHFIKPKLVSLCLVDGNDRRILHDGDVEWLADSDAGKLGVLFEACLDHCKVQRNEIEGGGKNSETTHDGDLPTN